MAGWWFGFGYFVPGLYWIGYAFLVDAPTFAWLMPFAVLGLPAYLALFPAFGFGLARAVDVDLRLDDRHQARRHDLQADLELLLDDRVEACAWQFDE